MNEHFRSIILQSTGASSVLKEELIQELWSGYGQIIRLRLENAAFKSVIVKHVQLPINSHHPRGWDTDIGHQRKRKSYKVEAKWYQNYSQRSAARLPKCLALDFTGDEALLVLEDLDLAGFPLRKQSVSWVEIKACIQWLAQFHASFLGQIPEGLWNVGTYWHLETRPQELAVLKDQKLKEAAAFIDEKLNSTKYKTLVHGDAKLANFCFSKEGKVAGLDFQYVGGGCGMKDLVYFVGSCLNENECERLETQILDCYFEYLQSELEEKEEALEAEWRSLYRVAWADFHRFLKGWSPGHWKLHSYSERITAEVVKSV
jgi:hypothetical protein